MRKIARSSRKIFTSLVATLFAWNMAYAGSVTIHVQNDSGTPISGAAVYAVTHGNNGPDGANSQVGTTDGDGNVSFTLDDTKEFDVIADKHGVGPTSKVQFFSNNHLRLNTNASGTSDITLDQTITGRGQIVAQVTNGTASSFLSGSVRKRSTNSDVAYAGCVTDGTGACDITFNNINPAVADTYDLGVYDSVANRGNGTQINQALAADESINVPVDIDGGLPPDLSSNHGDGSDPNHQDFEGAVVRGVVEDENDATIVIPYGFIEIFRRESDGQGGFNVFPVRGTGIDQNGRFDFFGLPSGDYYVSTSGGCTQDNCYKGYTSETAYSDGSLSANDFTVTTQEATDQEVKVIHVQLELAAAGTGRLIVKIRKEVDDVFSTLVPNSHVNLHPDHSNWRTTNPGTPVCNVPDPDAVFNPGFTQSNSNAPAGVVDITGITDGNYVIDVWTPYNNNGNNQGVNYNAGEDNIWLWGGAEVRGCEAESADDLRLNVNGTTVKVYDVQGNEVAGELTTEDSVPVLTIGVTPAVNNFANRLQGTFTFPEAADLTEDPITIILHGACDQNGCVSEFTFVGGEDSTPASSYIYGGDDEPLTVPDGSYWVEIRSGFWGIASEGEGNHEVTFGNGVTDVTRNAVMAPAGKVSGTLSKPDGSVFRAGNSVGGGWVSAGIQVRCEDGNWSHGQVNSDGTYLIGGILPGECILVPEIWSSETGTNYAAPLEPATVTIVANETVEKNTRLVNGVTVAPTIDIALLPALSSEVTEDGYPAESYTFQFLVQGTSLDSENIAKILEFEEENLEFPYVSDDDFRCGPDWPGGFCSGSVPANLAGTLMLFRRTNIDGGLYQSFTILGTLENLEITAAAAAASGDPNVLEVPFTVSGITPESQGTRISGTVEADNIIRRGDFDRWGGSFANFIKYIPTIIAKRADTGALVAAVLVTPDPAVLAGDRGDQLDQAVVEGNWDNFVASVDGLEWGYELRGLPASTDLILVAQTPNYPSLLKKVTTGADGSVSTLNIDWDSEAGAGGVISGTVSDSDSDAIASARVSLRSPNTDERTATTDENGTYSFPGLPLGPYKVTASADGYAPRAQKTVISGEETDTLNFALEDGPGSFTGTVTELTGTITGVVIKPVEGVTIMAYDDTVNATTTGEPLALLKTQTDSSGNFELKGLIDTHAYVVALRAEGRFPERTTVTATNGVTTGVDFRLDAKPLAVDVSIARENSEFVFTILNPQNFEDGDVYYYDASTTFDVGSAEDISDSFNDLPDGSLIATLGESELLPNTIYNLRIDAVPADGSPNVIVEVPFGLNVLSQTIRNIDEALLGDESKGQDGKPNNRVAGSDDSTHVDIDPGTMLPSEETSLPTAQITTQTPDEVGGTTTNIVGDATEVTFNLVQFTDNPLPFCMPFDAANVEDITELILYQFDPNNNEWDQLSAEISVDPVSGNVCGFINLNLQIQSEADLPGFARPLQTHSSGQMAAIRTNQGYLNNPRALASGVATFAVGTAQTGGVTATGYHQYNFPNPFNLKTKAVTPRTGTSGVSTSIRGTYIVVAPLGSGTSAVKIRIYNAAGDLVREFNTTATLGQYNYVEWDGKNTAGDDVASGVYFAVVDAPGSPNEKPIKMVLVK